jgi:hypothetical protein
MKFFFRSLTARRIVGILLFAVIAYVYTILAIKILLQSEQIQPVSSDANWELALMILKFPAFYFGTDPLTGLIINGAVWGIALTKLLLLFWSRKI